MTVTDLRLCFVGDSLVAGVGDPEGLGWSGRLCAYARRPGLAVTGYNLGVRGETSRQILRRADGEITPRLSDPYYRTGVVFSFGINDTNLENGQPRLAQGETLDNARQVLRRTQRSHRVLMVGPPPVPDLEHTDRLHKLTLGLAEVCRSLEIPFLDLVSPLRASPVLMREMAADDGFHPGAAGYAAIAGVVVDWPAWMGLIEG